MVQWDKDWEEAFKTFERLAVPGSCPLQYKFFKRVCFTDGILQCRHGDNIVTRGELRGAPSLVSKLEAVPHGKGLLGGWGRKMAVKWAIEAHRYYSLDNIFFLITDHTPFHWLNTMKERNFHVMQCYLSLQHCSFRVQHHTGKKPSIADIYSWAVMESLVYGISISVSMESQGRSHPRQEEVKELLWAQSTSAWHTSKPCQIWRWTGS